MIPKKMPVKDAHIVKIAVQRFDKLAQLINLDQRHPLASKIQEICTIWGINDHQNYALQFSETNNKKYVTEKNRIEIKNGSVLLLQYSPSKTAMDTLHTLREGNDQEKVKCLKELMVLSTDLTFALEFIKEKGLSIIINMIEDVTQSDNEILKYSLGSFVELMEHGTVSWEVPENSFVERNINIVRYFQNYQHSHIQCVESAVSNLENIVQSSKYALVAEKVKLQDLLRILQEVNSSVLRQNTIALINALFMKADEQKKREIADTISAKQYRLALIGNGRSTEMTHQLYVLQTLTLSLLEKRMRMKMNAQDQDAHEKIKELRHIAFDDYSAAVGPTDEHIRRGGCGSSSGGNIHFPQYYKKLGFKCDINPAQDFIETPPGMLALDCMVYFARNYTQQYTKIVHENSCRADEHECPFGRTSIELVKVLCDILRIGEPIAEQSGDFQPMFFTHDQPFEEFFCICVITLNRTWKDMRATAEDFQKVFSVVHEQITRTLKDKPENLEDFRSRIALLTYQQITTLRAQERTSKEQCDSSTSAIVKLKEKISPHIIELIKQQRLSFLVEGTRFSKYSRGTRTKDKFWYARLSPNHKVIHYGDCDEKTIPTLEELPKKLPIIDIKQLLEGRECPHMKEHSRIRKSAVSLAFSITFESIEHSTLDFVAPDETAFNYWTDGINALLGLEMHSKQQKEDFDTLLFMEIKLRLLDTEGVDISKDPPPIPEDPESYDFCFES
ncbi:engulfment and cell motility protein 1 [Scaptodrosophila lebanonensis]|uniref:Engulfment and cell motility protein 1 n=1 Tax=Drosophila lebanonensis TaxID=7225 RepID=A0A6J2U643_DROLE|nr:engulfment and cell motility protein 1 [Scaptodrosophila lebanonensis]